jgi:hypothetical protein
MPLLGVLGSDSNSNAADAASLDPLPFDPNVTSISPSRRIL